MTFKSRYASLVLTLWVIATAAIMTDIQAIGLAGTGLLTLCVLLALFRARRETLVVFGFLVLLGMAAWWSGAAPESLIDGASRTLLFASLLPVLRLARATASRMPDVIRSQNSFSSLPGPWREIGVQIGTHFFGAVLNTGAFAMASALMPAGADEKTRRGLAMASLRGMNTGALWSPFFVGYAVAQSFLPSVRVFELAVVGVGLAALGLFISALLFLRPFGFRAVLIALACLGPVAVPGAILLGAVLLLEAFSPLSTIEAVVASLPILCTPVILRRPAIARDIWREVRDGAGNMGDDLIIIAGAMTLGVFAGTVPILETGASALGISAWHPGIILFAVMGLMTLGGTIGLHPMISGVFILALLSTVPHQVAPLPLMEAMLIGWAFSSMNSISSLSVVASSSLFRVSPVSLAYSRNLIYAAIFLPISAALLTLVNALLTG